MSNDPDTNDRLLTRAVRLAAAALDARAAGSHPSAADTIAGQPGGWPSFRREQAGADLGENGAQNEDSEKLAFAEASTHERSPSMESAFNFSGFGVHLQRHTQTWALSGRRQHARFRSPAIMPQSGQRPFIRSVGRVQRSAAERVRGQGRDRPVSRSFHAFGDRAPVGAVLVDAASESTMARSA